MIEMEQKQEFYDPQSGRSIVLEEHNGELRMGIDIKIVDSVPFKQLPIRLPIDLDQEIIQEYHSWSSSCIPASLVGMRLLHDIVTAH